MRVLGVDPGINITGYGIVEEIGNSLKAIEWGVVKAPEREPLVHKLKYISDSLNKIIVDLHPDIAVVEDVFYSKNVKSLIKLSHARSAIILTAAHNNLEVFEYTPLEVKKSVVGTGRADKQQVMKMVSTLLKWDEKVGLCDISDALAVAICHIHTARFNLNTHSA